MCRMFFITHKKTTQQIQKLYCIKIGSFTFTLFNSIIIITRIIMKSTGIKRFFSDTLVHYIVSDDGGLRVCLWHVTSWDAISTFVFQGGRNIQNIEIRKKNIEKIKVRKMKWNYYKKL